MGILHCSLTLAIDQCVVSHCLQLSQITMELCRDAGVVVQITLAFLSKGPWDKLEARDQMTGT